MRAVDTNVLLYAHDPRDQAKQEAALVLLQSLTDGVLLWQVACEYLAASRKLQPLGYSFAEAWKDVQDLRSVWMTILPSWQALSRANELMNRRSLPFWDALILGACAEANVTQLYSEDLVHQAGLDALEIINPFRVTPG